jgi:cell division protein FtsB
MKVGRRRRTGQLIAVLVILLAVSGLFVGFFCVGPTGLFRIRTQKLEKARLQREVEDLKLKATVLESDIDEYQKPEKVKRIAKERLKMTERVETDSAK